MRSLDSTLPANPRTVPQKMAVEKIGQFGLTSFVYVVLLIHYRPLTRAGLQDIGAGSLTLPKTADCVALGARFEPSVKLERMCLIPFDFRVSSSKCRITESWPYKPQP